MPKIHFFPGRDNFPEKFITLGFNKVKENKKPVIEYNIFSNIIIYTPSSFVEDKQYRQGDILVASPEGSSDACAFIRINEIADPNIVFFNSKNNRSNFKNAWYVENKILQSESLVLHTSPYRLSEFEKIIHLNDAWHLLTDNWVDTRKTAKLILAEVTTNHRCLKRVLIHLHKDFELPDDLKRIPPDQIFLLDNIILTAYAKIMKDASLLPASLKVSTSIKQHIIPTNAKTAEALWNALKLTIETTPLPIKQTSLKAIQFAIENISPNDQALANGLMNAIKVTFPRRKSGFLHRGYTTTSGENLLAQINKSPLLHELIRDFFALASPFGKVQYTDLIQLLTGKKSPEFLKAEHFPDLSYFHEVIEHPFVFEGFWRPSSTHDNPSWKPE